MSHSHMPCPTVGGAFETFRVTFSPSFVSLANIRKRDREFMGEYLVQNAWKKVCRNKRQRQTKIFIGKYSQNNEKEKYFI